MRQALHNGFIFEKGKGEYLAVIETEPGVYWGIRAVYSGNNGKSFYADIGNTAFPNNIAAVYASFSLTRGKLHEILEARDGINKALQKTREIATDRTHRMLNLEDKISRERIAELFGDMSLSDLQQARVNFDYECDTVLGAHLRGR